MHGDFELHPLNSNAWQIFAAYGVYLVRMQRDASFKKPVLYSPDVLAIEAVLRLHDCADAEVFGQILVLLEEGLIPKYED